MTVSFQNLERKMKWRIILACLFTLTLGLFFALGCAITTTNLEAELATVTNELDDFKPAVAKYPEFRLQFQGSAKLKILLDEKNQELEAIRLELDTANSKSDMLSREVDSLIDNLYRAELRLGAKQRVIDNLKAELLTTNQLRAEAEEKLAGYKHTGYFREFASVKALMQWLDEDDTSEYEYVPRDFDCDDFTEIIIQNAWEDGYWLIAGFRDHHMFAFARIGNYYHKIEQGRWAGIYVLRD